MGDICVLYFFQGELGESLSAPNAFLIPGTKNPTFGDFIRHFPLPCSDMHFRFKFEDKAYGYSWMDIVDEKENLPTDGGVLTVKVLRTDVADTAKRRLFVKKNLNAQFGRDGAAPRSERRAVSRPDLQPSGSQLEPSRPSAAQPAPRPQPVAAPAPAPEFDFFSGSASPMATAATAPISSGSAGIDIDEGPIIVATPAAVVLDRQELQEKREEAIQDRVDAALKEKLERDEMMAKDSEDTDVAKAAHDARLTAWAFNNKEKRNVRTLLSTMHTVLWEGNTWKPIGLGDVIDPQKVKLNYRKAMLVVHPDRTSNQSAEIRFIGKRIFEAINDAYQDFLKKEAPLGCVSKESTQNDIELYRRSVRQDSMGDAAMDWSDWLAVHFAASSKVDDDFGLSKIAAHFGKQGAVDMYWEGARKEETGDVDGAIALYKRAFRAWPALDSVTDGGLPRGVRDQAKAAGLTDGLLSVVGVAEARSSRVVCSRRLLSAEDIRSVHVVKECVLSFESSLENNPQNATHKQKVGTFLNNPPSYSIQTDAPHVIGKMLRFAFQAWAAEDWSGNSEHPGPLYGITGGIQSLSIRVVEHWEYQVGSGLPDPLHYDTDSVITIVALLSESDDFEGGVFRTNESCGEHLEHRMDQGDTICFISHKYHNITPLTRGVRKSMVIELWQGGIGHTGR